MINLIGNDTWKGQKEKPEQAVGSDWSQSKKKTLPEFRNSGF
jgi:hypothetical protein